MCSLWEDLMTICEMAIEENDDSMLEELKEGYTALEEEMERERLETLLSGEYDGNNAIVSFQAGAGGTEAQDWAQMLYRMYTHWVEGHGLSYKILDYLDGDEAGIKSASILVAGTNAYGPVSYTHLDVYKRQAQNIIAAYFAGARFFEVKTVQKIDGAELAACVPRPCILAADEGYNQEWSTNFGGDRPRVCGSDTGLLGDGGAR